MQSRIVKTVSDLRSLIAESTEIVIDDNMSPMQHPIWSLSCAETLTKESLLKIVAVENDNGILGLAPLVKTKGFFGGFQQLGHEALDEPSDFYFSSSSALEALVEILSKSKKPVTLGRIMSDSKSIAAIQRAFQEHGIVTTSKTSSCPYIPLESPDGDVDQLLSSKLRSDLRRAQRKANTMGAVTFEIHAPESEQEFLALYQLILKVEAASWKGRAGSALAMDQMRQDFFRVYGARAADRGLLRIALMRIGSDAAAVQYAVQTGRRFWLLKIGYDEKYARCSPGMLLMYETLRYAAEQGLRSYELLGNPAPWTKRWTSLHRDTIRVDACRSKSKFVLARLSSALIRFSRKLMGLWQHA